MSAASIHAARTWHAMAEAHELALAKPRIEPAQRDSIGQEIESLERNGGTGIDAVFLANRGVRVLASDLALTMIELAPRRAALIKTRGPTDFRWLATENIEVLGSAVSNRKSPNGAIESSRAIPDRRARSSDDCARLHFERMEG